MAELYTDLLDAVQVALQQVRNSVQQQRDDLDGALIRLETVLQCLVWVEPVFLSSSLYSNLLSAVSDMIGHIDHLILKQNLLS